MNIEDYKEEILNNRMEELDYDKEIPWVRNVIVGMSFEQAHSFIRQTQLSEQEKYELTLWAQNNCNPRITTDMPIIDIVMTHKNRLEYLKRTLKYLWERTKSKYTLSIVDDGSTDNSQEYLIDLFNKGKLKNLVLHSNNLGYYSAINSVAIEVTTPFFVFMTDDTLVPDVTPDWLARLWQEFDREIPLGLLGLNNPTQPIVDQWVINKRTETIQYVKQICSNVIMFRNKTDAGYGDLLFRMLPNNNPKLANEMEPFSVNCTISGHTLGYLFDTYTQHIGRKSTIGVYENDDYPKKTFVEVDTKTLRPLEEYRE